MEKVGKKELKMKLEKQMDTFKKQNQKHWNQIVKINNVMILLRP